MKDADVKLLVGAQRTRRNWLENGPTGPVHVRTFSMTIETVITHLLETDGPKRRLDGEIAELLGWTRRMRPVTCD